MVNNYIHHTSGRSPKVGSTSDTVLVVVHVANNYYFNNSKQSFEVTNNSYVLSEANYFENVKLPNSVETSGYVMSVAAANEAACSASLGRACVADSFVNSAAFGNREEAQVLSKAARVAAAYSPTAPKALSLATDNFGVGSLGTETRSRCDV